MIIRQAEITVRQKLLQTPAVVLLGPRQVGKTTLARRLASDWPGGAVYLDLERPADRLRLEDADSYLRAQQGKLVIMDEIHRAPGVFEVLRGIIDDNRQAGLRSGQFLLLGSAALDLMRQSSETLAGRVAYLDIAPLNIGETTPAGIADNALWLRGGFPDSLLAADDTRSLDWRRDFIRSYLERDVPMFAPRLPAETIGRLWTMMAYSQGGVLNQSRIASALGVANPTIDRYIDLLVDLQLLRRLRPWGGNIGKRLVKSPKVYVRDSGILHSLMGIATRDDLQSHPVMGASWEGFVIDQLCAQLPAGASVSFYRTAAGAELDVVVAAGSRKIGFEIKFSVAPKVTKGFWQSLEDIGVERAYVVAPVADGWPMAQNVDVLPVSQLPQVLADCGPCL